MDLFGYYNNEFYMFKGVCVFGVIVGKVICSRYENVYKIGETYRVNSKTFTKIPKSLAGLVVMTYRKKDRLL
tara:strand:+ start:432 stop:647 length:216 start_codon:yes stop_codon:yes gene_type:complete